MMKKISIIVSAYNEEEAISHFYHELKGVLSDLDYDQEIVFVDDGSVDATLAELRKLAEGDENVKVISFSRNFGHESAMIAGIDHATGNLLVCMDADLQHPPAKIPEIVCEYENGNEVISMVRLKNKGAGIFNKFTSALFYKLLNKLSAQSFEPGASDFFAISDRVADLFRNEYRERARFLRGYVQIVGFNKTKITYESDERHFGESKYNFSRLLKTSLAAICGFSELPLRLGIYSGFFMAIVGIILLIYTIITKIVSGAPSGYTTIIVALCFMFAISFFVIGMIGEYIAIILAEVKSRPLYIVKEKIN